MPVWTARCRNQDPGCVSMGAIQRGTSWATIPKTLNRARTVHAPCAHRARTVRQRPLGLFSVHKLLDFWVPGPPPPPGVVKQNKSSGGSVDTTKTRSGPQRVRMSSGERPIGAAKGKQSDTEALCQPPPPPRRRTLPGTAGGGYLGESVCPCSPSQLRPPRRPSPRRAPTEFTPPKTVKSGQCRPPHLMYHRGHRGR